MARRQHEPVVRDAPDHRQLAGLDDARLLHLVGEAPVGHLDRDRVTGAHVIDVSQRGGVRRAMARDRDRAGRARKRRLVVDPGALAQRGGVRSVDDDEARVDRRDADAPDGRAAIGSALQRAGEKRHPAAVALQRLQRLTLAPAGGSALERAQVVAEAILHDPGVDPRDGLLPGERQARIGKQQRAGDDQHRGQRAQPAPCSRAHRFRPRQRGERTRNT